MSDIDIHVILYDTLLECMADFLGCEQDEVLEQEGVWQWAGEDGVEREKPMQEAVAEILDQDLVWGWIEDKEWLHLWYSDQCPLKRLLGALAHEIGHVCRPHHRSLFTEETKACKYGATAMTAYSIMQEILDKRAPVLRVVKHDTVSECIDGGKS